MASVILTYTTVSKWLTENTGTENAGLLNEEPNSSAELCMSAKPKFEET